MLLKRLFVSSLFFLSAGSLLWAAEARPGTDAAFEESLFSISFDSIDTSGLRSFKLAPLQESTEEQFEAVVRRNLKFIYHNKLNRRRFLVAPEPQSVVDRIAYIFEVNRRLDELVVAGRGAENRGQSLLSGNLIKEIRNSTKELKEGFNNYFVEGYNSTYVLKLSASDDPATQWAQFLLESSKICNELNVRLLDYFLNPAPEAISLRQFKSSSVNTLVDALLLLTEATSKRIPGIR